jgi:hypothetical protein
LDATTYILDSRGRPVPEPDERIWSQWLETDERCCINETSWEAKDGLIEVSTRFLGFNALNTNPPTLWESAAWLYPKDGSERERIEQWNYISRTEAVHGHADMVRQLGWGGSFKGWRKNGTYGLIAAAAPVAVKLLTQAADLLSDGRADGVIHLARRCFRI